jgi:hypothetical protein
VPYYLKKYAIKLGIIFVLAFVIAANYPRHTAVKRAWGFPFEYRFVLRDEYARFGGQRITEGFNISVLATNIWLIFIGLTLCLFTFGTVHAYIKKLTSTLFKY